MQTAISRRAAFAAAVAVALPGSSTQLVKRDPIQEALNHLDQPAVADEPENIRWMRSTIRGWLGDYQRYISTAVPRWLSAQRNGADPTTWDGEGEVNA